MSGVSSMREDSVGNSSETPSAAAPKTKDKKLLRLKAAAYFNKSFVHDEISSGVPYDCNNNTTTSSSNGHIDNSFVRVKIRFRSTEDVHEYQNENDDEDEKSETISKIQSYLWISLVLSFLLLPFVIIGISAANIHSCPGLPALPIMLLTLGCLMMMVNLVNVLFSTRFIRNHSFFLAKPDLRLMIISVSNMAANLLIILVFMCMTIWIHVSPRPETESCSQVLYLFALSLVNVIACFLVTILVISFTCYIVFTAVQILKSDNSKD